MRNVITAVSRNDALANRAIDNLKRCIELIEDDPSLVHNGGVMIILCGERLVGEEVESWTKPYYSMDSTLKILGALHHAAIKFMREGEQ
jgi:hypothetical protein